jgi:hypothetical protein
MQGICNSNIELSCSCSILRKHNQSKNFFWKDDVLSPYEVVRLQLAELLVLLSGIGI